MSKDVYLQGVARVSDRKKKFVTYIRNVLIDYTIQSAEVEVECETPIEAAMVFFQKNGKFPTDIHEVGARDTLTEANTALRTELVRVRAQRDNFSASLTKAVAEREIAVEQINKLHELAQTVVATLTIPLGGQDCA